VAEPATLPSIEDIERASAFTREPFLTDGEDAASALAPGTPRRRALDSALEELETGAKVPSPHWRRHWSLLLGLDRLLSQDEPKLIDGTVLSAHQVDALSGTLTALLADRLKNGDAPLVNAAEPVLDAGDSSDDDEEDEDDEPQEWTPDEAEAEDVAEAPEDPNAGKRFWFEHATGAGKTVAAVGFVEASRTGGILILTHRRNLVDQFHGELRDRGYAKRIAPALLGHEDTANGPVTVETYQWFVRNAGNVSDAYSIVICDEAHTALGEKTSAAIRAWTGPVFVGMTATGALIARHVTDLFPTQTSRFDLAQAARRGVISPLRCVRIPPGPGVRTIAKVPLRRGEMDTEFDQEMLAQLLDQLPFNLAIADLYKTRFNGVPGVVYAAGVRHAYNVAAAFREIGMKAQAVSGETPKRELAQILARYERGDIDVLVNAQLLAEGWNSPRATVCMHLAPTASKRIYQQRVGRVTRRHQGKEAGIVVDFVHPATKHDDPVVTLHSLLDRDVYRGGAIVVGPVRRGRGRRLRVERRVLPVTSEENRRIEVFERELWRIAVEHLDYGEQVQWAALAGARVAPTGWRRARAMLHFDQGGELKRTFLITAVDRNKNPALRLRALQEIASGRDAEAFDRALDFVESWPRDDKREGVKVVLQALAEKKIGRRDQANNWIWRCANMTREVHEEYAVQRWPETKRLLGLLVNSSGGAHARNARRLVHAARQQDRRLSAALLAASIPHTAEAGEVINGARTRMSRKPAALARELLRNFPKGRGKAKRRRRRRGAGEGVAPEAVLVGATSEALDSGLDGGERDLDVAAEVDTDADEAAAPTRSRRSRRRPVDADPEAATRRGRTRRRPVQAEPEEAEPAPAEAPAPEEAEAAPAESVEAPAPPSRRRRKPAAEQPAAEATPSSRRGRKRAAEPTVEVGAEASPSGEIVEPAPPSRRRRKPAPEPAAAEATPEAAPSSRRRRKPAAEPVAEVAAPKPRARRKPAAETAVEVVEVEAAPKPARARRQRPAEPAVAAEATPSSRRGRKPAAEPVADVPAPKPARSRRKPAAEAAVEVVEVAAATKPRARRKPAAGEAPQLALDVVEPAAKPRAKKAASKRAPRRAATTAEAIAAEAQTVAAEAAAPKPRARRKPAAAAPPLDAPGTAVVEPKPRAKRKPAAAAPKPRAKAKPKAAAAEAAAAGVVTRKPRAKAKPKAAAPEAAAPGVVTPKPRTKAKPKAAAPGVATPKPRSKAKPKAGAAAPGVVTPKPKAKAKAKAAAKRKPAAPNGPVAEAAAAVGAAVAKPKPKPAAKRRSRAKPKPKPAAGESLADASERVRAAVEDAAA
jgi:ribonuclease E